MSRTPYGLATALETLLTRLGRPPLTELDDDPTEWDDITDIDEGVEVDMVGASGSWPSVNGAIIKFQYQSGEEPYISPNGFQLPNIIDHYCIVTDWVRHQIYDPADGMIKTSGYGQPVGWATFLITNPPKAVTYETYPVAKKMYVSKPEGADKYAFGNAQTWRDFIHVAHLDYGSIVYVIGIAHHPIAPNGQDFYMDAAAMGDFGRSGRVAQTVGYKVDKLTEGSPPIIRKVEPVVEPVFKPLLVIEEPPKPKAITIIDHDFRESWMPEESLWTVAKDIVVRDHAGKREDKLLKVGTPIKSSGYFFDTIETSEGTKKVRYERPILIINGETVYHWYGVPKAYLQPREEVLNHAQTPGEILDVRKYNGTLNVIDRTYLRAKTTEARTKKLLNNLKKHKQRSSS